MKTKIKATGKVEIVKKKKEDVKDDKKSK